MHVVTDACEAAVTPDNAVSASDGSVVNDNSVYENNNGILKKRSAPKSNSNGNCKLNTGKWEKYTANI